jgi:hypothetical protein
LTHSGRYGGVEITMLSVVESVEVTQSVLKMSSASFFRLQSYAVAVRSISFSAVLLYCNQVQLPQCFNIQ